LKHPSKILQELEMFAGKSLGQNFLTSESSLQPLEKYIPHEKPILEIRPGLGQITNWMLQRNIDVTVCEKDSRLAQYLEKTFSDLPIFNQDFLLLEEKEIRQKKISFIIGNLPFYITTPILIKVMLDLRFIQSGLFGIQREMAERCVSTQGNSLGVLMQSLGKTKIVAKMSKNNFFPVPKVDVAWIHWQREEKISSADVYQILLRGIFWGKRKNLQTTLLKNPFFDKNSTSQKWKNIIKIWTQENKYLTLLKRKADSLNFKEIIDLYNLLNEK